MSRHVVSILLLLVGFVRCARGAEEGELQIADGRLQRGGAEVRAVGVNYFDCFLRTLTRGETTSYEEGFAVLAEYEIPFARFCATGYWPSELKLFQADRAEYFRRMDLVVRSAEKHGIGLIPSLFWWLACVPDLVKEPVSAWGDPSSKTHEFMREYVQAVVSRYAASPAIWAWEFGNEYSLVGDLPNAMANLPAVQTELGTRATRTARDALTYDQIAVAFREFGREVRKYDPVRPITTGDAILRTTGWHNRAEHNWKKDSAEESEEMLKLMNPEPVGLISIHCYGEDLMRIGEAARAAASLGKSLFLGEFQVKELDSPEARVRFEKVLAELEAHKVALAAIWVFDFAGQEGEFNIRRGNGREWELEMIREANRRIRAEAERR